MRESIKIIQQACEMIPEAGSPVKVENFKIISPSRNSIKYYMENLIRSF